MSHPSDHPSRPWPHAHSSAEGAPPALRQGSARPGAAPAITASQRAPIGDSAWDRNTRLLAQGLIRLNEEGRSQLPTPQTPDFNPPALAQPNGPIAPGIALGQIVTTLSQRAAFWESERLLAAMRRLRDEAVALDSDAFFYTDLRSMNIISHAIEERVIAQRLDCEVYSGFQRLALLRPQLPRYRAMLDTASFVYAYGIDDARPGTTAGDFYHPRFVRFRIDQQLGTGIEWFWFVVVDDPRLHTALLAQHMSGDIWNGTQSTRTYTGFWTFDIELVREIIEVLRRAAVTLHYGGGAPAGA